IYRRGKPDEAAYIGYRLEAFQNDLGKFWTPSVKTASSGSVDAVKLAAEHIRGLGPGIRRVGIEAAFLPADADGALRQALPECEIVDVHFPLERLRAQKTAAELRLLREASERVVASMLAAYRSCAPGVTKAELVERLRREEVERGLTFEYCLVTAGRNFNRPPPAQRPPAGGILSPASGGGHCGAIWGPRRAGRRGDA